MTVEQAQDLLIAVAPIVGAPRTMTAAVKIATALGLALNLAESAENA